MLDSDIFHTAAVAFTTEHIAAPDVTKCRTIRVEEEVRFLPAMFEVFVPTVCALTKEEKTMRPIQDKGFRARLSGLICLFVAAGNTAPAQTAQEAPYLQTARQLVRDLHENALVNEYGSQPTYLRWSHPTREARTVCATFVTHLLEYTYGWKKEDISRWLGANGADASEWWEAIVRENGFRRFKNIEDIHPGDLLAIKYNDGSKDTGHVMLVDRVPQRVPPTAPIERGTEQYSVEVIDSSASGHGLTDTRHKADGGFTGGIGEGAIRLYAGRDGRIVGYAWSETPKSKFYQSPARDLVAGRLTREKEMRVSGQ